MASEYPIIYDKVEDSFERVFPDYAYPNPLSARFIGRGGGGQKRTSKAEGGYKQLSLFDRITGLVTVKTTDGGTEIIPNEGVKSNLGDGYERPDNPWNS
ncbi:hypothetical protein KC622_02660 [Candidatus Dojkabacteria bacterium]|uniref:Uncharacterized protein n=1 Tax=Candidatus Dojkabacteria bacterium TaxID=2099670 RepID=A0A955HY70_9BACT|nr:hypothetical protein [Candidatus Dojkabacteria bacterium]